MQTFSSKESKRDVLCKETDVYSLSPIARRGMGYSWSIRGIFMGYSWDIHGVFICVGYVSVMYRLCVGYATENTSSEGDIFINNNKQFRFNNENNERQQ